jgi:two-component system, chemotaxis family, CheB/CheR fusion protein
MNTDDLRSPGFPFPPDDAPSADEDLFPVVGVGASAGGLQAFTQLLADLPTDTGMAFVFVQHLSPTHTSHLSELLAAKTAMPVVEVSDGLAVQPNHIYVIPSTADMVIEHGVLRLTPRLADGRVHSPIDRFMRSVADDRQSRAIGVILSGTGTDGSLGIGDIKEAGGITFAQDEASAEHAGMPSSAVMAGHVDFVLPPEQIARELKRIAQHWSLREGTSGTPAGASGDLQHVFAMLREATDVDFSQYRDSTFRRRIARRMALRRTHSLPQYADLLKRDREELQALYRDALICVTRFFRDPDVFDALKTLVFPEILTGASPELPIRVWVPGCSTGEEAYSLAIALLEFLDQQAMRPGVQIFATDVNDNGALDRARAGVYTDAITADVSPERLRRFFSREDGRYRIGKAIREMVVFARQNMAADPPFSRMDLVSCRNVLIYLSKTLQARVLPVFHYALNPGGFLLLGSSESVGRLTDLFAAVDPRLKIFKRQAAVARLGIPSTAPFAHRVPSVGDPTRAREFGRRDLQKEADRIVLGRYAPAGVLVNANLEVLQFRGHTRHYLEPPSGDVTLDLLPMVRDTLFLQLRNALDEARDRQVAVRREGIRLRDEERIREVNVEVVPVNPQGFDQGGFLILFEDVPQQGAGSPRAPADPSVPAGDDEVAQLRQELGDHREYLQAITSRYSAATEELQAANEEILSANEELQSTNEELQTSKEEIQSNNEELVTLNEELRSTNLQLSRIGDDFTNALNSVRIPLVMVGADLCIRRFTPSAATVFNLIPTDLGRPLGQIRTRLDVRDLEQMVLDVTATVSSREREVRDAEGRWHALRVFPYRTADNRIDGAVLVLMDIDETRRARQVLQESRDFEVAIVDTVREPLLVLDATLCVQRVNRSFCEMFHLSPTDVHGRLVYELSDGAFTIPSLRALLEDLLRMGSPIENAVIEHTFPQIGWRRMEVNARRLNTEKNDTRLILMACEDVTERTERSRHLENLSAELERANAAKDRFLAVLSHELRTPLSPVLTGIALLERESGLPPRSRSILEVLRRNVELECRLIEDLLDVTRIAQGRVRLEKREIDLCAIIDHTVEVCRQDIEVRRVDFDVDYGPRPYPVEADAARLQQVFWNLLKNAIKFTPAGGCIGIRCRPDAGDVVVEVSDSGMGIPPSALDTIFDRFSPETSTRPQFVGLGLGLTICKALVEGHGGAIQARSEGENRGATFVVRLPLMSIAAEADRQTATEAPTMVLNAHRRLRVLFVEDHGDTAEMMVSMLEMDGHDVHTAGAVATALDVVSRDGPFDLLISDLGLPDASGLELMRELRGRGDMVPGIALSGYGRETDLEQSRAAGFAAHLVKPAEPRVLLETMRRVTSRG